jgi:D-glycero-D-manno-heptose 1,7-bisphosphate phosphatase
MIVPEQAAILCGGLGTRLRPLTDKTPKPMVPVNGKPFLECLLVQLRENGIKEVILMTGYLGEQISQFFGDGASLGLRIKYSHGPAEWDTGRRLIEAKSLLNDYFLLLYSDNFVPFNLNKLARFHDAQRGLLTFVVHPKSEGNIRLAEDGKVEVYDKTRKEEGLDFVELGYMIILKEVFGCFDEINVSFSDIIFKLVCDRQVSGMIVRDAYHSISDLERLKLMEEYLKPKKILLIDRDGILNKKAPKGDYVTSWEDFIFLSKNVKGLRMLAEAGYEFIVISNQAGIARGMVTWEAVDNINQQMKKELEGKGIPVLDVLVCPHHWDEGCFCRKPNPGMFFKASRDWLFRLDKTFYIGDDPRDCQAACNAGCGSVFIGEKDEVGALSPEEQPNKVFNNLEEAAPFLMNS